MAPQKSNAVIGWVAYILIAVTVGAAIEGYEYLDGAGLIEHTVETNLTAQGNWFVGESKSCFTNPFQQPVGRMKVGYAVGYFTCDDGPAHEISVEVWGRKEQPEYGTVVWKCTRQTDKFVCLETGGIH